MSRLAYWLTPLITGLIPAHVGDIDLGKRLFYDVRLSANSKLSCASCHDPKHGFSDSRRFSIGVNSHTGKRHAPTLIGRRNSTLQFWDGRVRSLEEQILDPIQNPDEMGMTLDGLMSRLRKDPAFSGLTVQTLSSALAAYVRTIRSVDSPFDAFLQGSTSALSDIEREGLRLFRDRARCYICHSGDALTDESFHNTGVTWNSGSHDRGRAAVSSKDYNEGAFKTPTLREIASRAPYMHDGSIATLEEVIDYYDRGGSRNAHLDENMESLHLSSDDKLAILAFLRALSGSVKDGH